MSQFQGNQIDFIDEQIRRYKNLLSAGDLKSRDAYKAEIKRLEESKLGTGTPKTAKAAAAQEAAKREAAVPEEDAISDKQGLVDALLEEPVKEEPKSEDDSNANDPDDEKEDLSKLTKPELIKLAQVKTKDSGVLREVCKTKATLLEFLSE